MAERTGAPGGDSPTESITKLVKLFSGTIGQLQGFSMAMQLVLAELLTDMALTRDDPRGYLAEMFERISANREKTTPEMDGKPDAEAQQTRERLFAAATNNLLPPDAVRRKL